jgi:hypothetical protein
VWHNNITIKTFEKNRQTQYLCNRRLQESKRTVLQIYTPEIRKAIENYFDWNTKLGEKLILGSPLFRKEFDTRSGEKANVAPMSEGALKDISKD